MGIQVVSTLQQRFVLDMSPEKMQQKQRVISVIDR